MGHTCTYNATHGEGGKKTEWPATPTEKNLNGNATDVIAIASSSDQDLEHGPRPSRSLTPGSTDRLAVSLGS